MIQTYKQLPLCIVNYSEYNAILSQAFYSMLHHDKFTSWFVLALWTTKWQVLPWQGGRWCHHPVLDHLFHLLLPMCTKSTNIWRSTSFPLGSGHIKVVASCCNVVWKIYCCLVEYILCVVVLWCIHCRPLYCDDYALRTMFYNKAIKRWSYK